MINQRYTFGSPIDEYVSAIDPQTGRQVPFYEHYVNRGIVVCIPKLEFNPCFQEILLLLLVHFAFKTTSGGQMGKCSVLMVLVISLVNIILPKLLSAHILIMAAEEQNQSCTES